MINDIRIDRHKHKIRLLINGMRNTRIVLREFILILRAEMGILQTLISETEYLEFISDCFGAKKPEPEIIRKAEQIIKDFSEKG